MDYDDPSGRSQDQCYHNFHSDFVQWHGSAERHGAASIGGSPHGVNNEGLPASIRVPQQRMIGDQAVQPGHIEYSLLHGGHPFGSAPLRVPCLPGQSPIHNGISSQSQPYYSATEGSWLNYGPALDLRNASLQQYETCNGQGSMTPSPMYHTFHSTQAPSSFRYSVGRHLDPLSSLSVSASSSRSPSAERRMPSERDNDLLRAVSGFQQPASLSSSLRDGAISPSFRNESLADIRLLDSGASLGPTPVQPGLSISLPIDMVPSSYDYSMNASPNQSIFTLSDGGASSLSDVDQWDLPASFPSSQRKSYALPPPQGRRGYAKSDIVPAASADVGFTVREQYLTVTPNAVPSRRKSEPARFKQSLSPTNKGNRRARSPLARSAVSPARSRKKSDAQDDADLVPNPEATHAVAGDLPSGPQRGRRQGPLAEETRQHVRKMRSGKLICIRCKFKKVGCHPSKDLEGCPACLVKVGSAGRQWLACARASFMRLVFTGSLNYVAQRSINHHRGDFVRRRRLAMPELIDFPDLIFVIRSLGNEHNIRVLQGTFKLYDLKLDICAQYLSMISSGLPEVSSFRQLIDSHLQRDEEWMTCVEDEGHLKDPIAALSIWNNMPSRVTYSLVRKPNCHLRVLDPDYSNDERLIYASAQLSRIIGRKLELSAYSQLEQMLLGGDQSQAILALLANQLLSLRWRISWWIVIGSGIPQPSEHGLIYDNPTEQQELTSAISRTTDLCKTFYVYYCNIRRQTGDVSHALKHKVSRYADTCREVRETLPFDDTADGFTRWMKDGCDKIRESRAVEQLRLIGLT